MAETTYFPRRLILAGAIVSGVLLALAVHMLGARYGLDLGGLWRKDTTQFMPAGAAVAWWLIATVGFSGGYFTANLMDSAVSGQIPQRMRQFLIAVGVLILAGAIVSGVLLALAVHMLGARYGLDLGGLWRSDTIEFMPAGAAIAWWLIATVGFSGGYFTANLMHSAASGQIPQRMRQFLIAVGVLILAGAGQAASAPSPVPTISGVLAGLAALCLGAAMAFCGAHFALRKA